MKNSNFERARNAARARMMVRKKNKNVPGLLSNLSEQQIADIKKHIQKIQDENIPEISGGPEHVGDPENTGD